MHILYKKPTQIKFVFIERKNNIYLLNYIVNAKSVFTQFSIIFCEMEI